MPGEKIIHGAIFIDSLPVLNIPPQEGIGIVIPSPRKESALSVRMAPAIPKVALTSTGAIALGKTCLKMMRFEEYPRDRPAITNS